MNESPIFGPKQSVFYHPTKEEKRQYRREIIQQLMDVDYQYKEYIHILTSWVRRIEQIDWGYTLRLY